MNHSGLAAGLAFWVLGWGLEAAEPGPPPREVAPGAPVMTPAGPSQPGGSAARNATTSPSGDVVWDWWVRQCAAYLEVHHQIVTAPKLDYRLDKIEVYRDGVWGEFAVTNPGPKRRYITPLHLRPGAVFRDAAGRGWRVPQFHGFIQYVNPHTFYSLEAGGTVRFRSALSTAGKPLEPVLPSPGGRDPERPAEVSYTIAGWTVLYTKLSDTGEDRESVFARGSGKVPVLWFDQNAPESARGVARLGAGK